MEGKLEDEQDYNRQKAFAKHRNSTIGKPAITAWTDIVRCRCVARCMTFCSTQQCLSDPKSLAELAERHGEVDST